MDIERLKLLEVRVEELLAAHAALCRERDQLRSQLGEAQARIEGLVGQLQRQEQERAEVRVHVERIMSRLDALNLG